MVQDPFSRFFSPPFWLCPRNSVFSLFFLPIFQDSTQNVILKRFQRPHLFEPSHWIFVCDSTPWLLIQFLSRVSKGIWVLAPGFFLRNFATPRSVSAMGRQGGGALWRRGGYGCATAHPRRQRWSFPRKIGLVGRHWGPKPKPPGGVPATGSTSQHTSPPGFGEKKRVWIAANVFCVSPCFFFPRIGKGPPKTCFGQLRPQNDLRAGARFCLGCARLPAGELACTCICVRWFVVGGLSGENVFLGGDVAPCGLTHNGFGPRREDPGWESLRRGSGWERRRRHGAAPPRSTTTRCVGGTPSAALVGCLFLGSLRRSLVVSAAPCPPTLTLSTRRRTCLQPIP